jgi:phosphoenolpyruvate synthase/pyruvate phosphate dikinase
MKDTQGSALLLALAQLGRDDIARVGGKNASLGENFRPSSRRRSRAATASWGVPPW